MYEAGFLGEEGFHRRGAETQSQAEPGTNQEGLGTKVGEAEGGFVREKLRVVWLPKPATRWVPQWSCSLARNVVAKSPRKFGLFHKSARRFTKVRTDQARKSSIVRIVTGKAYFFKKARKSGSER